MSSKSSFFSEEVSETDFQYFLRHKQWPTQESDIVTQDQDPVDVTCDDDCMCREHPDYAAVELEHLGDPDAKTGIYAPDAADCAICFPEQAQCTCVVIS